MLRNPSQIGAVVPSGRALARAMTAGLNRHSHPVIEIGPGTGSITDEILARGVPRENLCLYELDPVFCTQLRGRFPGVAVHNKAAQTMDAETHKNVGTIVSSLPMLNIPLHAQHEILFNAFSVLRPKGTFVQFTYSNRPPLDIQLVETLKLTCRKRPKTWANLPPATVYVYSQSD